MASEIASDTAPLHELVQVMINAGIDIHVLRDPTRGGVTSARTEIAQTAKVGMLLDEASIPISEEVKEPVKFWGLILFTSPMKANCWPLRRRTMSMPRWNRSTPTR
jgi:hydrogenase maturation factor